MDLFALITFCMFLSPVITKVRQIQFVRQLPFEDRNMTTGILATSPKQNVGGCASYCVERGTCMSFIYSPETKECQLHNTTFPTTEGVYQQGLQCHYLTEAWCPIEDGYQLLAVGGPCVKFHTQSVTVNWHVANQSCSAYSSQSRLVILDTQEKNDLVKVAAQITSGYYAIGLSEREDEVYRWVNGADVDFSDWINDSSNPGTDYCVWLKSYANWRWMRYSCAGGGGQYICEIPSPPELF